LRASRHPLVDWGAPLTLSRTFWTVSAQAFQKAVATSGSLADLPMVAAALARELNLIGALLALGGLYLLVRRPALRRMGLALAMAALGDAATPALVGFDPANPDAYGYLEVAVAVLAILACVLPAALLVRVRERRAQATAALLAVLACVGGAFAFPRFSLAGDEGAARTMAHWANLAPPRALVVTSYFQTVFVLYYLDAVEGVRPDTDLVHRHFLAYPGYRDELLLRRPALAPLIGARDLARLPDDRAAMIEYDLDLPAPFVRPSMVVPVERPSDEPQARRFAAWQAFLAVHRACRLGDAAALAHALAAARQTMGTASPELDALAEGCAVQK
jgi:hypothetical protein